MACDVGEEVGDVVLEALEEALHRGLLRVVNKVVKGHDEYLGQITILVFFSDIDEVIVEFWLTY